MRCTLLFAHCNSHKDIGTYLFALKRPLFKKKIALFRFCLHPFTLHSYSGSRADIASALATSEPQLALR